jgi:two-component sensor histidine kinase
VPDIVLNNIIQQLSRAPSEDEIITVASHAARLLLQADGVVFAFRDGEHCYYAGDDAVSPLWKGRRLPIGGCAAGWCMTHDECVAIDDVHQDSRVFTGAYRPGFVRGLAVSPVGHEAPIAAALGAYWSQPRRHQPEELEHLKAIADGAALGMANLRGQYAGSSDRRPKTVSTPRQPMERSARHRASLRPVVEDFLHEGLRPGSLHAYAFAIACVLVAAMLRLGVQATGIAGLNVFSLFYPATLIATLVGGRRSGLMAAALGGLAAHYVFAQPLRAFVTLTAPDLLNLTLYAVSCTTIILIVDWYQRTVARLKHEDARHLMLAREQQHRARNAVFVVETIIRQGLRDDPIASRIINQRIRAAFADVDIHLRTRPIGMAALLTLELAPFDLRRFSFESHDEFTLEPEVASILSLAAHELATNALKYGALSSSGGQVTVGWRRSGAAMVVHWREVGGPRVQQPDRRGYGSILLQRLVESAGGELVVEFAPTGVTAEMSLPFAAKRGERSRPKSTLAKRSEPRRKGVFQLPVMAICSRLVCWARDSTAAGETS